MEKEKLWDDNGKEKVRTEKMDSETSSDDPEEDEPEDEHKIPETHTHHPNTFPRKLNVIPCLLGMAVAVVAILYYEGNPKALEDDTRGSMNSEIINHIRAWQKSYPHQENETWYTIAGQMLEFVSIGHMSPLVFVMAYNEGRKTTKMLASEISRAALQLKNGVDKCGDMDVAKISGSDHRLQPGFLLSSFASQAEECRKMILFNLEELDGNAAKELHSLLDPDYPNIHNVVYIFTVKIPNVEKNVYDEVQKTLRNHWSAKIDDDRLNPLFSRLVNNVKIIPEPAFEV